RRPDPGQSHFLSILGKMSLGGPLGLFSRLWVVAAALHHLEARPLAGLPLYPFVVLVLVFPDRLWAIAVFAVAHVSLLALDLPAAANHSVLALLIDVLLLIGCARAARVADPEEAGRAFWDALRGPVRATVICVYFFAIFHKLNSSFFDPEVSCATSQLAKVFRLHGLQAWEPAVSTLALNIQVTLVAEAAILVLLLWPRTAHLGALAGLLFHSGLAWASFFDFATVVFAAYLFFFSWDALRERMRAVPRWAVPCFLASLVALSAVSFYLHGLRGNPLIVAGRGASLTADTLICLFWLVMTWPILLPLFAQRDAVREDSPWTAVKAAWVVPAVALINGATPYLGLKTVANYSMFSNLRTEGGRTNHLLVPAGRFALATYQEDIARVSFVYRTAPERWPVWVRIAGGERWVRRNS